MMTSLILASPRGDSETMQASSAYSIFRTHTTYVVHNRLRSHRRRQSLQVLKLGDDALNLAESLEDDGQHSSEEVVTVETSQILAVVLVSS